MTPAQTRVFVVDDHPLVREWLDNLLRAPAGFRGCAAKPRTSRKALAAMTKLASPDVAIVDLNLKTGSGIELIARSCASICPRRP